METSSIHLHRLQGQQKLEFNVRAHMSNVPSSNECAKTCKEQQDEDIFFTISSGILAETNEVAQSALALIAQQLEESKDQRGCNTPAKQVTGRKRPRT